MAFQVDEKLPGTYFPDIINSHIMIVKAYLDALDTPIAFSPHCGSVTASFRFYANATDDATPLLCYTISNFGDLQGQLYQFWVQLFYMTKGT